MRCLTISLLLATGLMLAGCSMAQSELVTNEHEIGCQSTAGAYNLSKGYLALDVSSTTDPREPYLLTIPAEVGTTEAENPRPGIGVFVRADPEATYCLDYLASPTSDDTFDVKKTPQHLLTKITSTADDKSADIARTLIQALFVGLSGDPNFPKYGSRSTALPRVAQSKVFSGTFDPFNIEEVTRVNEAIHVYGYCVFLDGRPVDIESGNPGEYCEHPAAWLQRSSWSSHTEHRDRYRADAEGLGAHDVPGRIERPAKYARGVFYRARLPYSINLYQKDNLKLHTASAWKLRGSMTALLENASPVFSVGVDRTFFANRQTTLEFDRGVLQDVNIKKSSELVNFVSIPLQIAQSIAALPAAVIQVKINDTNQRGQVIAAQAALLQEQTNYLKAQADFAKQTGAPGPLARSGEIGAGAIASADQSPVRQTSFDQCLPECAAQYSSASESVCRRYCGCVVNSCTAGDPASCRSFCQPYLQ